MKKISVLLVDDHQIVRQGLINLLKSENWIDIVGEAGNGREAIQLVKTLKPDITVLDIGMPELNGIQATKQIVKQSNTKIIALTIHNNMQYVQEMIKNGASGYLLKDCAVDELIEAIRCVANNKYFLSKTISQHLTDSPEKNVPEQLPSNLSDREKEVLQLIAEGNNTKTIGEKLFLSPKTIESHRKNIMEKLNIHTIPELTQYAIKTGIVQLF